MWNRKNKKNRHIDLIESSALYFEWMRQQILSQNNSILTSFCVSNNMRWRNQIPKCLEQSQQHNKTNILFVIPMACVMAIVFLWNQWKTLGILCWFKVFIDSHSDLLSFIDWKADTTGNRSREKLVRLHSHRR